jgi:hypothetical protein
MMAKTTPLDLGDLEKDLIELRNKTAAGHDSSLVFQCGHCGVFWWKEELWSTDERSQLFEALFKREPWTDSDFDEAFSQYIQHPARLCGLTATCQNDECNEEFLIEPLDVSEHLLRLQSEVARSTRQRTKDVTDRGEAQEDRRMG